MYFIKIVQLISKMCVAFFAHLVREAWMDDGKEIPLIFRAMAAISIRILYDLSSVNFHHFI